MERIKHALELAKQHQKVSNVEPQTVEIQTEKEPKQPQYSETRVEILDKSHLEKNRIVAHNKNDYWSLPFDILRTQVLAKMKENGWRTIAISSPIPECGKSVVAINLAMSIAQHTTTTAMLVDFDLRRPRVGQYLGLSKDVSLNNVLSGDVEISEALVNPSIPRFVVLPTAKAIAHSSEVLSSQKVQNLISEMRNRYEDRIILFDLPPILGADDAITMMSQVDCILLVVANGAVSENQLQESMRHIRRDKLLGTVLNKSESTQENFYGYD